MKYLAIIVMALIVACAPAETPEPEVPELPVEATPPPVEEPAPPPVEEPEMKTPNPKVQAISEKVGTIKGYSFTPTALPEITGDTTYFVRGNMAKVELVSPYHMDGWSADYVFVDYDAQTATAYCLEYGNCKNDDRKGEVPFEEFGVPLPPTWLDQVQYGEQVTALQYNNRPIAVIQWEENGKYYEAYLDTFYGFPQRVAIASDEEFTNIIGGYEYQSMALNAVSEEEVQPPY